MNSKEADSDDETANYPAKETACETDKLTKVLDAYKSHTIDLLNSNVHSYRQRFKRTESENGLELSDKLEIEKVQKSLETIENENYQLRTTID